MYKPRSNDPELFNFWPAFTDGLTGLFIAIILLFLTLTVHNFINVTRLIELEELLGRVDRGMFEVFKDDPDAKPTDGGIVLGDAILFDYNSSVLRPEGKAKLQRIGFKLKSVLLQFQDDPITRLQVRIEGHTDTRGWDSYNQELSAKRAEAVARYWEAACDLDRRRFDIAAIGRGPYHPVVKQANTEADHQKNRRIEVRVYPRFDALIDGILRGRKDSLSIKAN